MTRDELEKRNVGENLDALMEALKGEIHTKEFDLYAQAEGYRVDERKKIAKKLVTKHNTSSQKARKTIEFSTEKPKPTPTLFPEMQPEPAMKPVGEPMVYGEYEDKYKINGKVYTLQVKLEGGDSDLFWVDVSKEEENIIICHINTSHVFFEHFGQPNNAIVAVLKTLAIAKYTAKKEAENDAAKMVEFFNEYIKRTKV